MTYSVRRTEIFKLLNGLVSIYKPPNINLETHTRCIKQLLADNFNALPAEPKLVRTLIHLPSGSTKLPTIATVPDIVDDELVLGRRFMPGDFLLYPIDPLSELASGIQVYGIGEDGVFGHADRFEKAMWLKTYHLTGMLGRASSDGTAQSPTLVRATWRHVTRTKIDRVVAGLSSQFKATSLVHAGLRPNSQSAYLALCRRIDGQDLRSLAPAASVDDYESQEQILSPWDRPLHGEIRTPKTAADKDGSQMDETDRRQKAPYVNFLKCINFEPPFFTLEIQVSHETLDFFINLIANLGPKLRTATVLCKVRRIRHGPLLIRDALLLKRCVVPDQVLQYYADFINSKFQDNDFLQQEDDDILDVLVNKSKANQLGPNILENLHLCTRSNRTNELLQLKSGTPRHLIPIQSTGS